MNYHFQRVAHGFLKPFFLHNFYPVSGAILYLNPGHMLMGLLGMLGLVVEGKLIPVFCLMQSIWLSLRPRCSANFRPA